MSNKIGKDTENIVSGQYTVQAGGDDLTVPFMAAALGGRGYARIIRNNSSSTLTVTLMMQDDASVTGTGKPGTSGVSTVIAAGQSLPGMWTEVASGGYTTGQLVAYA